MSETVDKLRKLVTEERHWAPSSRYVTVPIGVIEDAIRMLENKR